MPTLYERLTLRDDSVDSISVHGFKESMYQFHLGECTAQNVIDEFNLDPDQVTDATTIYQKSNSASNKLQYFNTLFSRLVLAEGGHMPTIFNETNFWTWVNSN